MKNITIMIKPASGQCNMRCKYCFYYDVMENREKANRGFMKDATSKRIIERIFESTRDSISIIFQGGEPTLIGLDYYKNFVDYLHKSNSQNIEVNFSIQTNGTNLTEEYVKFFKDNNFLVGISLDGHKEIHDLYRHFITYEGSYDNVIEGISLLNKYKVNFNILSVVTEDSLKSISEIYPFLTSLGSKYLQFIPFIDSFDAQEVISLSSKSYGKFLIKLFDLWYKDFNNNKRVSIRYFDDILSMLLGYQPNTCTLMGKCYSYHTIEANGDVYPCDFYVLDEWKIGNIYINGFDKMIQSEISRKFIKTSIGENSDCISCKYYKLCKGGCRRNKEPFSDILNSKTKYCQAIKSFLDYSLERFIEIGNTLINEQKNKQKIEATEKVT